MKTKNFYFFSIFFLLFFLGCQFKDDKKEIITNLPIESTDNEFDDSITKMEALKPLCSVGEENFNKLVNFIEENGDTVYDKGVPCNYQIIFCDIKGNKHAMVTLKTDKNGNPSINGSVKRIIVWSYYKGIMNRKNFFGYFITKEGVFTFIDKDQHVEKNVLIAKRGYKDFLNFVLNN